MNCIATFYTHAAALLSDRRLKQRGYASVLGPVPRELSSSCGTCVRYNAEDAAITLLDPDVESVYELTGNGYNLLYHNE